jgi:hypothetical protein
MENKFQSTLGGRVGEARTETTSYIQIRNNLKRGSLDTPLRGYSTTLSVL